METIFLNSENSKTNKPHIFKLDLADKPNLENPNKNMALANLSFIRLGKTSSQNTGTINLKLLHQYFILLIYLVVLILLQIFRIILNLSLKNMKL